MASMTAAAERHEAEHAGHAEARQDEHLDRERDQAEPSSMTSSQPARPSRKLDAEEEPERRPG